MSRSYGIGYALQKLTFYEWAYGRLGELDDGLGPLGEFVVGLRVGGLAGCREEKAPVDLVGAGGTTYEVKTNGRIRYKGRNKAPVRTWGVFPEADALEGRAQLADRWIFLVADFPAEAASRRFFNPFDQKYWTVYMLTGGQMRATGVRNTVTEGTLRLAGAKPCSLDALGPASTSSPLELRIDFFRWAYGDLSTPFNFGRLAEFQVMRACGRPTLARASWAESDVLSLGGHALEVKASCHARTTPAGTLYYLFATPVRRVRTPAGEEKRRTSDYFVFATVEDFDPACQRVPLDLDSWRFVLVPTEALGTATSIRSTKLAKLGYPSLSAQQLHDALC